MIRFLVLCSVFFVFFFNDTATTEIYTLSLHDALPICGPRGGDRSSRWRGPDACPRSEEHTSELQSRLHLVCRLLLEKKKKNIHNQKTLGPGVSVCSNTSNNARS